MSPSDCIASRLSWHRSSAASPARSSVCPPLRKSMSQTPSTASQYGSDVKQHMSHGVTYISG